MMRFLWVCLALWLTVQIGPYVLIGGAILLKQGDFATVEHRKEVTDPALLALLNAPKVMVP